MTKQTPSTQAQAAKLIRKALKDNGVTAKVSSESASMMTAVRVKLVDALPATRDLVTDHAKMFQYGSFDGMDDSYNYTNKREDLPQVTFVTIDNTFSAEMKQAAYEFALKIAMNDVSFLPKQYTELTGSNEQVMIPDGNGDFYESAYTVVRAILCGGVETNFWTNHKPRVKAA